MKKLIHKYTPNPAKLREQKSLSVLGEHIYSQNLWHVNRHSIARAFAVGLFCAWIPVPGQMILAAIGALLVYANMPISIALVWLTNPITMPPMFYGAYWLGAKLSGTAAKDIKFELSFDWLGTVLGQIWQPFLLGCLVLGVISSALGYFAIKAIWRYNTVRRLQLKRKYFAAKYKDQDS